MTRIRLRKHEKPPEGPGLAQPHLCRQCGHRGDLGKAPDRISDLFADVVWCRWMNATVRSKMTECDGWHRRIKPAR